MKEGQLGALMDKSIKRQIQAARSRNEDPEKANLSLKRSSSRCGRGSWICSK